MTMPLPRPVGIARDLLEKVYREARASYPKECCGWLSGPKNNSHTTQIRTCVNAQDNGEHPTKATRNADTAYVIAGADLLALNRELDGDQPAKLIYHSHSNGRACFSATDHEVATSPWGDGAAYPVQQLVVGIGPTRVQEAALFAWSGDDVGFVEVQRFAGAEI